MCPLEQDGTGKKIEVGELPADPYARAQVILFMQLAAAQAYVLGAMDGLNGKASPMGSVFKWTDEQEPEPSPTLPDHQASDQCHQIP